jgi:ribosome maturation factor RimP
MENQDTFKRLLTRKVKVVYKEFGEAMQIGKGILSSVDKKFLTLDGDVSTQIIPIDSIIKVSALNSRQGTENGSRQMGSRV